MAGPSAMGSENGMPSSMMSAPAAASFCRISKEHSASGSPAVMKGMNPARSSAQLGEARSDAAHSLRPRAFATVNTSLSPRPERPSTINLSVRQVRRDAHHMRDRMRGFQGRNDAFQPAGELERIQGFLIRHRDIIHAARLLEPGMFRPDAGIIEAGRDRMRFQNLAVRILQQIGLGAVQHAGRAFGERGGVMGRFHPLARRLDAMNGDVGIVEERMEQPDGIGAAADAGDEHIGQPPFGLHHLRAGFLCRSRSGNRAPWRDRDAGPPPSR